ncbi:MAG: AAA family ATPase [Deinococcus-Thermus bacterium]|nr:AAA family ATPase [Deinococcota bacterium]
MDQREEQLDQEEEEVDQLEEEVREQVISNFLDGLGVARDPVATVLMISFTSEDPEKAALIANTVANEYIVDQLEARYQAARRATDWLNDRLTALQAEVQAADQAVADFRRESDLLTASGAEETDATTIQEERLAALNATLAGARSDLAGAEAQLREVNLLLDSGRGVDALADVLGSAAILELRGQEAALVSQEAELERRLGELHPERLQVANQLRAVRAELAAETNRIVQSLRTDVEVGRARVETLERQMMALEGQVAEANTDRVRLRELQRQAAVSREIYEGYLQRFQETRDQVEQSDIELPEARVISEAAVPIEPAAPNKRVIMAGSGVMALVMAMGVALLAELADTGLRTPAQAERVLRRPCLAIVPRLRGRNSLKSMVKYLQANRTSAYAEAIRTLRASIALAHGERAPKIVLIAGARPGDGATSTAVATALTAAQGNQRTLLIEGDMRQPAIAKALGVKVETGLAEVLSGRAEIDDAIVTDPRTGVDLLTVTSPVANPSDLLGGLPARRLMNTLRERYDLLVVEAPPLLGVADGRMLAKLADSVVLTLRWKTTTRGSAREAANMLTDIGAELGGIVLARVNPRGLKRFDASRSLQHGYVEGLPMRKSA